MALLLREISATGTITDHALEGMSTIEAAEGSTYSLIDSETQMPVEGLTLKRRGDDLDLEVEGESVANVEGFYGEGAGSAFSDGESVVSTTAEPGEVWTAYEPAMIGGVEAGLVALGVGGVALASGGGGAAAAVVEVVTSIITVAAAAGPFITTMGVEIYDTDGNLLQSLEHDFSTGPVDVEIEDYTGAILIKVVDINGTAVDYLDEATGTEVSLGAESLRAMATTDDNGEASVSVTPLTELATVLAGVTDDNVVTEEDVATNDQVAELFGLTDILAEVTTIVDEDFDTSDGTSDAEAYGAILAVLSGADSVSGSVEETIAAIVDSISEDEDGNLVLAEEAADLIAQGENLALESEAGAAVADAIEDAVTEDIADTTAPTTTVSGIAISADSGDSAEDFITNTAAQTITATLSAALASGEVLMASTDGGTTFVDITDSVNGTAVSFAGTLSSGSIQLRVDDAAGNSGEVATQPYTLDTTAPVITGVVVNEDSTVSVTFDTLVDDLVGDETSFTLTVNGEAYSFIDVEAEDGSFVVTLTPAQDIYGSDTVSGLTSTATDLAGNAPAAVSTVTNNSNGDEIIVSKAFAELTSTAATASALTISQSGLAGNDLLQVDIFESDDARETSDANAREINSLDVNQLGGIGNDTIKVSLDAQFIGGDVLTASSTTLLSTINTINQEGGAGDDALSVEMHASAPELEALMGSYITLTGSPPTTPSVTTAIPVSTTGAIAEVYGNDVSLSGGAGADSLVVDIDVNATAETTTVEATPLTGNASASIDNNDIQLSGDAGNDSLAVSMTANALQVGANGNANAFNESNIITLQGGDDTDEASIKLVADAVGNNAYATVSDNWGIAYAESIDIDFIANASAVGSAYASVGSTEGAGNTIHAFGNNVDLDLVAHAVAGADAYAYVNNNQILAGGETVDIDLTADAAGGSEASAYASNNQITASGDQVNIDLIAQADGGVGSSDTQLYATSASAYAKYNNIAITADSQADVLISANAQAEGYFAYASATGNELDILGGSDVDDFSVAIKANASLLNATTYYVSAYANHNQVSMQGAAGDDTLYAEIAANAFMSAAESKSDYSYAYAGVTSNHVELYGGEGSDSLTAKFEADAQVIGVDKTTTEGSYLTANIYNNLVTMDGGTGSDSLSVIMDADAAQLFKGLQTSNQFAAAQVTNNDLFLYGSAGSDNLLVSLNANAVGTFDGAIHEYDNQYVSAFAKANYISADGGSGNDYLDIDIVAKAKGFFDGDTVPPATPISSPANSSVVSNAYAIAQISSNNLTLNAGSGATDTISVVLSADADATFVSGAYAYYSQYATANVNNNSLDLDGGIGIDHITVDLYAKAFVAVTSATAYSDSGQYASADVSNNTLYIDGGSGNDVLDLGLYATATASFDAASAYTYSQFATAGIRNNTLSLTGSDGSDVIAATLQARASVNHTNFAYAYEEQYAKATANFNTVALYGSDGIDSLSLLVHASADASLVDITDGSANSQFAQASVQNNDIDLYGGAGADTLTAITISADAIGLFDNAFGFSSSDQYVLARVTNNNIYVNGGSDTAIDSLSLLLDAHAQADFTNSASASDGDQYALALLEYNTIEQVGGGGADNISVGLYANAEANFSSLATASSQYATARVRFNTLSIDGGSGSDVLGVQLTAIADTTAGNGSGDYANAIVQDNAINIDGGNGVDTINLNFVAETLVSNTIYLAGGAGADIFSIDTGTQVSASGVVSGTLSATSNEITFYYGSTGEFGDSINGLDEAVISNIVFSFDAAFAGANYQTGGLAAVGSSTEVFYYDTFGSSSSFALYYDADGTGSASAQQTVAVFDADVAFDIHGSVVYTGPTGP